MVVIKMPALSEDFIRDYTKPGELHMTGIVVSTS
jgi:hypothetical protein